MKKYMFLLLTMFFSVFALAQTADPDQTTVFFGQVFDLIKNFGGLGWMSQVAAIVMIIVSSMKVSFIKPLWDGLGSAQVFIAPALGLIGGIFALGTGLTWQSALAYIAAGAGAIMFHELLDAVKAIPGLGSIYIMAINLIESLPFIGSGGSSSLK